ncbi:MAG TPA: glycogen synthase GlgA [Eubacteriaceae bacterium]|jgi:starch synthase|nr:glycogen synthase GlgA [Eubacteriaceae bacterium]
MKILYAAAEAAPFIKTGGLADVAGSLPPALKKAGEDIRVVIPLHSGIDEEYKKAMVKVEEFYINLSWRRQYAGIFKLKYKDTIYYFLDNEYYFNRNNPYGEFDDGERYAFFSKAILGLIKILDFKPDVIHANDWHTGLVSLYLKDMAKEDDFYKDIKSLFTIHNLKYQGVFDSSILSDVLGLSYHYYHDDGIKFYDAINYMKAGIVYSDGINTVSNTYAQEIKYKFFGEKLEGILRKHEDKLSGIINGIDYDIYNPYNDKNIAVNYDSDTLEKKADNKLALQKLYGLKENKDIPLVVMISRLDPLKGIDLIKHVFDEILQQDLQMVILGTGHREYEDFFRHFQGLYPDKLRARLYFDEGEAHQIYAGGDILLMPSMIEPCGISQLIALRYGTIPIVREIGGLKDTIQPFNKYTKEGVGFSFKNYNAHELLFALKEALKLYNEDKKTWKILIKKGMETKNDWAASSREYIKLYQSLK